MADKDMQEFMSDDDRIHIEEKLTISTEPSEAKGPAEHDTVDNHTDLKLCSFNCMEQNTKVCRKCNRQYCIMHASRFSPNLCQECFKNVQVVLDKFSRTFEHIAANGQLYHTKETCDSWHIDGPDWPFLNLWINKMTDDELREIWMFHFFVIKTIEVENDLRKIAKRQQLANTNVPITKAGQVTGQMKVTTTKTTKTTQVVTAESVRQKLIKSGITDSTILDMMVKAAGF